MAAPTKAQPAKAPQTFLGGLRDRLGDPTVGENIPLGSYALSIAGVFMIALVWPLVMGGTISLAILLSGEDPHTSAPNDAPGYAWFEAGLPPLSSGACNPLSTTQTGNYPNPATQVVTSATAGQFAGLRPSINYTDVQSPGPSSTNSCGAWFTSGDDKWVIQIPGQVLNPGTEDAISRLSFEVIGSSGCSTNIATCSHGFGFDEVRLEINGTAVVTLTGADAETASCSRQYFIAGGTCTQNVDFNITLSGLQSANIADEMAACGTTCNVTLHFIDGFRLGSGGVQSLPFTTDQRWSVEVFSTNADTAGWTLRLSVWGLTAATLALAVGATPAWNPLRQWLGNLQMPDAGGGLPCVCWWRFCSIQ